MPNRLSVPSPFPQEEQRLLAEALADLHSVIGIVVENAHELVPGESVDELLAAWEKSSMSLEVLVNVLAPSGSTPRKSTPDVYQVLENNHLTGEAGKAKRSMLGRLKDAFLMYWNSLPRTDEKRKQAAEAAADYAEFGATVVSSAKVIPGYHEIEEILLLVKQLLTMRARRGF